MASGLNNPIAETYDTPGRNQTLKLTTPFLVSSEEEIATNYLEVLNQVYADNPLTK